MLAKILKKLGLESSTKKKANSVSSRIFPDAEQQKKNKTEAEIKQWLGGIVLVVTIVYFCLWSDHPYRWYVVGSLSAYLLTSINLVRAIDRAAMFSFGSPLYEIPPGYGLVLDLFGIYKLYKYPNKTLQQVLPGKDTFLNLETASPRNAVYADLDNPITRRLILARAGKELKPEHIMPTGWIVPVKGVALPKDNPGMSRFEFEKMYKDEVADFITHRKSRVEEIEQDGKKIEKDDLHGQIEMMANYFLRWRILEVIQFAANIGTIKDAIEEIQATSKSVLTREFLKRTPAMTLNHEAVEEMNWMLQNELQIKVQNEDDPEEGSWGVFISDLELRDPKLPDAIVEELNNRTKATISIKTERDKGKAAAAKKTEEGKGEENYLTSIGKGRKNQLEEIKAVGVDPNVAYQQEASIEVSKNVGSYTVVNTGGGPSLLGELVGANAAISGKKKPDDDSNK